jgi:hypothetical protein
MKTEINDCLNFVHDLKTEISEQKAVLQSSRKKDMEELTLVREGIAEWVENRLKSMN